MDEKTTTTNVHLKMRRERDRVRRRTKKLQDEKKRSPEIEDHEQRLATLIRLKRGDENELERKLKLEKVVATTQLMLALETEEERRAKKGMDLILIYFVLRMEVSKKNFFSRNELACHVMGIIF